MPIGQNSETFFKASLAGSALAAKLSTLLFNPRTKRHGVPFTTLLDLVHVVSSWRDEYLSKVGVPAKWPEDWGFLAAITACSTDVYHHCLWLIVTRAIDEFGIIQSREDANEVVAIRERFKTESDHAAMRIAALVCFTAQRPLTHS